MCLGLCALYHFKYLGIVILSFSVASHILYLNTGVQWFFFKNYIQYFHLVCIKVEKELIIGK